MAIANTAGLLSGGIWYTGCINREKFRNIPLPAALGAMVAGLISLFAYQSGFGCFVIPFLLHYISSYTIRKDAVFGKGMAFYFGMFALYFVLFKLSLSIAHMGSDARTGVTDDPSGKITYFLREPLHRAFWFNFIMNTDRKLPWTISKVLMGAWVMLAFIRFGKKNWLLAVKHIVVAALALVLSFWVSMVVKEDYPSSRTMLGIDMCVFILWAEMVLYFVKNIQVRRVIAGSVIIILCITAWFNFNLQFLKPIQKEYTAAKNYVQQHYTNHITTVYFIMPAQDEFQKQYGLHQSMDEFGVPSTSFEWVPENFAQQLVYEKTGNRETAQQLAVKYWKDEDAFAASGERVTDSTLVVNMTGLIEGVQ
jgi:hypothetical protein